MSWGNFAFFGFTQNSEESLKRKFSIRFAVVPRIIKFGRAGNFFFYANCGDVDETEQTIGFKLGFVRSPNKVPMSTRTLLDEGVMTPNGVDHSAIRGNSLLICFDKSDARFAAYKNLLSMGQIYYRTNGSEFIGATSLRCLVMMLESVELNPAMIPYHFLFRQVHGPMTYFKNIERLFPGQLMKWRDGNLNMTKVQDFRFPTNDLVKKHGYSGAVDYFFQELAAVTGAYIQDIEAAGLGFANMLSGGVDSSLLQLIISELRPSQTRSSYSFAPQQTPSYNFEIDYARHASEIFQTKHTFVKFNPEDYPALLIKAIETLAQPVLLEVEPAKMALAQYVAKHNSESRFLFTGQGADTIFGLELAAKLKTFEILQQIPGARFALRCGGWILKPFHKRHQIFLKVADILSGDLDLFVAPINTVAVYTNLAMARRAFGDEALREALAYRRSLEEQYLNSRYLNEKVHVIDLLSDTYEIEVQSNHLFMANHSEQIYPYMDDEIIQLSFAFPPHQRYIKNRQPKAVLKEILVQHNLSSIANKPKGGSIFNTDLYAWMKTGPLQELIHDITLPDFLSRADFEKLIHTPDRFLWALLTFDLFMKKVVNK